jgi:hypothetical protein
MAEKKKPVDEEAHWRIDEIERSLSSVPSTDMITGIASGVAGLAIQEIKRDIAEIKAKQESDVELDRQVVESNRLTQECIRELIEQLKKPTSREITAQLPSGPVTMLVQETRN